MSRRTLAGHAPVAIGGVGGSGTRVVALILKDAGYFMGGDVNESEDNLSYSLLFNRIEILRASGDEFASLLEVFISAMSERRGLLPAERRLVTDLATVECSVDPMRRRSWLRRRARHVLEAASDVSAARPERWGWKEPNTHIVLDRLQQLLPRMRYIHVVRNGLDMAYSSNQRQARIWGPLLLGGQLQGRDPGRSLRYWCYVHRRVLEIGRGMGPRFLCLKYEDLCADPLAMVSRMARFLEVEISGEALRQLSRRVRPPVSKHRVRELDDFSPEDLAYVASLGFDVG